MSEPRFQVGVMIAEKHGRRPIWVRHQLASFWCAVSKITGGSIETYCRGRWSLKDVFDESRDPDGDRCAYCSQRIAELSRVERCLDEMRTAIAQVAERFVPTDPSDEPSGDM